MTTTGKSGTAHAAPARLTSPAVKNTGKATSGANAVTNEERRRGQRVLLRIRANIHVALQGQATTFEVNTLSVNPRGALVVMTQSLPAETRLVLEHRSTRERVACKVARTPREVPEGFQVPLEFDTPAPSFWKIAFPPADWRPDDL
ncbi:MAG TPA: hypothetical protein VNM68_03165 [Candidatus Polarisedimenticolia bacterium]|nr:hypothetical protein [Candidatus Polarisedimenticolia bacterium]